MKLVSIAGIQRATVYSPNHVGNDAAIFSATARWLEKAGYQVNMYTEQEFLSNGIEEKVAMTMLRNLQSMKKLQDFESKGCLAINSARYRELYARKDDALADGARGATSGKLHYEHAR